MEKFEKIKIDSEKLLPISEGAIVSFRHSLPRLVFLVNEKFVVENKFCCEKPLQTHMDLLRDIHKNFGDTLLAVYQFQIYDVLVEEFAWLVSTLHHRGFEREYFEKMLNAWIMAIHGTIEPSFSHQLVQPLSSLEQNLQAFLEHPEISAEPQNQTQKEFLNLLLQKRRRDATEFIISLLQGDIRPDDLCNTLVVAALKQIGLLWQKNEISVADEHAAAEICRYIIFRLCDSIPRKDALAYKALVTCVPGEEHELGAEIVASHLENEGWTVYFVGHSAPEKDNIAAIVKDKPDIVFLTAALVSNLPQTVELSEEIRRTAPNVKIILGGRAAVIARCAMEKFADAIIQNYREAHSTALRLLGKDA